MGMHKEQGFTIIETVLVLAITGVLIAGLLVGIGSSINVQRYKDSVSSFKAFVQSQYALSDDVSNDRADNWTCGSSAVPVQQQNGGQTAGQSDCVLLGRYITIVNGDVTSASVVGYENTTSTGANDIAEINSDYTLGISTSSIETTTLEWGAQIAWPVSGGGSQSPTTPRSIAILIIRSPTSGSTYTFTSDTVNDISAVSSATLKSMMVLGNTIPGQSARTICLDASGVTVPENYSIYIEQAAGSSNSIETRTNAIISANGGDTKC